MAARSADAVSRRAPQEGHCLQHFKTLGGIAIVGVDHIDNVPIRPEDRDRAGASAKRFADALIDVPQHDYAARFRHGRPFGDHADAPGGYRVPPCRNILENLVGFTRICEEGEARTKGFIEKHITTVAIPEPRLGKHLAGSSHSAPRLLPRDKESVVKAWARLVAHLGEIAFDRRRQ